MDPSSSGRLTLFEIESFVRNLERFPLRDVGSDRWMAQSTLIQKLNIEAHLQASSRHDETVVDQFVTHERVDVLVHELLVIEVWKDRVFPLLLPTLSPLTSLKVYLVLMHEATIANLLEMLLYHASAAEAGGESILELADYCARKLNLLNTGAFRSLQNAPKPDNERDEASTAENLKRQSTEIGFGVAVCAVSLLRFLTEHLSRLPLGVTSRLLNTHDVLLSLVPLVESPPWTRRSKGGKVEKFSDQRWAEIRPEDALLVTRLEGQVWLAIYNLVMDPTCRSQYVWHSARKDVLQRLKRHFSDVLLDQLPPLRELKRFVEELSLVTPPPPSAPEARVAVIEQLAEMRDSILAEGEGKWASIAEEQRKGAFGDDPAARQRDLARMAATFSLDSFDEAVSPPRCGSCGKAEGGMKRCSRCKSEWYCSRACQVANWKTHQKVCDIIAKDSAKTASSASATAKPAAAASSSAAAKPSPAPAASAAPASSTAAKPAAAPAKQAEPTKPAATQSGATSSSSSSSSAPAKPPVSTASAVASGKIVMLDEMD